MNKQWDIQDHYDSRIIDFSYWHDTKQFNKEGDRACIYVFANLLHQIRFVSISTDIIDYNQLFENSIYGIKIFKKLYLINQDKANELFCEMKNKYCVESIESIINNKTSKF